jgi:translation initiation factor IF-2
MDGQPFHARTPAHPIMELFWRWPMSENGHKIEIPATIVVRDLALKIEKSPIELIKKLMSNGVMATINQTVDFDTAAIIVAEYGFEAIPEVVEIVKEESGEVPYWRRMIAGRYS